LLAAATRTAQAQTKIHLFARDDNRFICRWPTPYFQKGFFKPAGLSALSSFASAPESSEIFSSVKRDEGA
jgi:hypothetical protein